MTTILLSHTPEMRRNYYGDEALARLRALAEVRLHEGDEPLAGERLIAAARGCRVIVSDRQTPGETAIFAALPELAAFVRCAVDIRTIDVPAASAAGVLVTRASPGFVPAVAELVLGLMVDLARGITTAAATYRAGRVPVAGMGRQLFGATVGIVGYGAIGRYLAPLCRALGMTVLVADPYVRVAAEGVRQVPLDALLAEADFVVPLAVATAETENLMDGAAFARMKPGALFVNVSRGNLVDEAALAEALDSGRLAGAALDVGRAADQMPTPAIAGRPTVVATPHVGGLTPQSIAHQALETTRQVAEILAGQAPEGAVNQESWSRRPLVTRR